MSNLRVLIVEDSYSLSETYKAYLNDFPVHVVQVETGAQAIAKMADGLFDCVILDVNLPDMTGLEIMSHIKAHGITSPVIVITANGSINLAVEVMRNGAFDFIVKPFNSQRLKSTVTNALDRKSTTETTVSVKLPSASIKVGNFVGSSLPMQNLFRIIKSAAPTNATIFVTGESGTGKELCAEALHVHSKRNKGPFITLNCAAIPKDLLESEIFGHVKGAFTGATSERNGSALQADGGTLFLDEVCEMDLSLQSKLLRFLQTRQVQRLGEDKLRSSNVRIVCATNRNPHAEVLAGRFREDLFYRLHVIPIDLPPLRERGDDILAIAAHFLTQFSREDQKEFGTFSSGAANALLHYRWPGNIRQLQNVIRNIVVLNDGEEVLESMLPYDLLGQACQKTDIYEGIAGKFVDPLRFVLADAPEGQDQVPVLTPMSRSQIVPLEETIRQTIQAAIDACNGSIPRAAGALDVSPSTLYRRMESWKVDVAA